MTRLSSLFALTALTLAGTAAAQRTPPEPRIIGWHRACTVSLRLTHGSIAAGLRVEEDGRRIQSPRATWTGNRPGSPYLSIIWQSSDQPANYRPGQPWGQLNINMSSAKGVPPKTQLRVRRPGKSSSGPALTAILESTIKGNGSLDRHSVGTILWLDDLLNFATGVDSLYWVFESLPDRRGYTQEYERSSFDLAPLREAMTGYDQAVTLLDAKAAKFATECEREAEYDDVGPDIV